MSYTKRPGFEREAGPAIPFVSTANSTSTLLTAGSSFTGEWEEVGTYDSIIYAASTDQNGTVLIQFSPDGVNVDSSLTRYYRTDLINPPHRFTIARRYFRIVFTNTSASDQTYLRLQTTVGDKEQLNIPLGGTISSSFDATVVRPTVAQDEEALGSRQGVVTWHKWGFNSSIDIAAAEMIWEPGGNMTFLTTASTLTVSSSSVNDTNSSGTGATGVVIYGIDANRKSVIEVLFLNGTTPVVSTNSYLGVNRLAVYACGSLGQNAGKITATATTGGSIQATIPAGLGTTQQCIFFSQDSHTALLKRVSLNINKVSAGTEPVVQVRLISRSFVSNARYELMRLNIDTAVENTIIIPLEEPLVITEKSVVYLEASTDKNGTAVTGRLIIKEVRDQDE